MFVSRVPFQIMDGTLQPVVALGQRAPLRIGTCSLRRTAQLKEFAPQAEILSLRGNVDTRLRKLDAGEYDGIVLASAGLHRLEMQERLAGRMTYFPLEMLLPAPGQGAIALECRNEAAIMELLMPLRDDLVQATTSAERMFMYRLGAGCYLPVAAYASVVEGTFTLRGLVASLDGEKQIRLRDSMPWNATTTLADAERLGVALAEQALERGAHAIIQELVLPRDQERLNV